MRSRSTHDFHLQRDYHVEQSAQALLAIVDLESYPAFFSEKADRLDLLQHLCRERDSLTAMMWEVPAATLRLHLLWTSDEAGLPQMRAGRQALAGGAVRTSGELCLASDEQLLASARQRHGSLLQRRGRLSRPDLLLVPSGVYTFAVYDEPAGSSARTVDYTVLLHHHLHPAPRLHPMRLNGLAPFGGRMGPLDHPVATPDWADSHKMPR